MLKFISLLIMPGILQNLMMIICLQGNSTLSILAQVLHILYSLILNMPVKTCLKFGSRSVLTMPIRYVDIPPVYTFDTTAKYPGGYDVLHAKNHTRQYQFRLTQSC